MRTPLRFTLWAALVTLAACGSDDGEGQKGGDNAPPGGQASAGTGGGGSGGGPAPGKNCGEEMCDLAKQYCRLAYVDRAWQPDRCVALDSCPPPPTCQPDPSACATAPDPSACINEQEAKCSVQRSCECLAKTDACPSQNAQLTTCKLNGGLLGFGCTTP
jgi:hypothetical protein